MSDQTKTGSDFSTISVDDVIRHVEAGDVVLLDVRRSTHGKQIYGAVRYDPKKLMDAAKLAIPLPKTAGSIVLYDEKGDSKSMEEIADKLRAEGFAELRTLEGGFAAYESAGGKTEETTIEQPVPLVSEHQIER